MEDRYRGIELPVPGIPVEAFEMRLEWRAQEMLDYMRTWSASQRYLGERGEDPVLRHAAELMSHWGKGKRSVRWPLTLKAGRQPA